MFVLMKLSDKTLPTAPLDQERGTQVKLVNKDLGTEKLDLHLNILKPRGNHGMVHRHTKSDNVYIVRKGMGEFFVDGKVLNVVEGDIVYIPAGVEHSLSNTSDDEFQIFEIYSPAGNDYDFITGGRKVTLNSNAAEAAGKWPHGVFLGGDRFGLMSGL